MHKNINQLERFKYYSELAAKSERQGDYSAAKTHWQVAGMNAPNLANNEWCKHRAAFCERVVKKSF